MTKYRKALLSSVFFLMLVLPACGSQVSEEPTEDADTEATAPEASATPEPAEPTKRPTNTPPQTGPLATAAALAAQTTLVPPTPYGGEGDNIIAPDDYVGIFDQAWRIVEANYVRDDFNGVDWDAIYDEYLPLAEQVTSSEELWEILYDLIAELNDNHSRFISPNDFARTYGIGESEPRAWSGVYLFSILAREDEYVMPWCISPGSSADLAGLKKGDHILAVDGMSLLISPEGLTRDQLRGVLFGTGGDTVTLTVQQGPNSDSRDVVLDLGYFPGCNSRWYSIISDDPYIGYYRESSFEGDTDEALLNAIEELESERPLDGLIIDVRHNGGGSSLAMEESIKIFTEGMVGTEGSLREGATRTLFRIRGPIKWNETTPVVVLTDGNSHSAADYFAIIMQYLGRAVVIGMNSAGNIEGWNSWGLADGSQIGLTYTSFLLEDGTDLEGIGATPDVIIPLGDWGLSQTPFDVQLQAAIDYLIDLLGG